jgi:cytochrome c oxidase assembly protein subunit 15
MRLLERLSLWSFITCFCVVVLGAYVRLSDAGLGCPDWPGCYGHLTIPQTAEEVARAEAQYPQRPVEAPKAWKEMIHRYLASFLGLLILIMAGLRWRLRDSGAPRVLPYALLGLVIFQGVLGMWTVTWQLKPLVVTAHLMGGMTTLALLFLLWLKLRRIRALQAPTMPETPPARVTPGLRRLGLVALIVLVLQIFLGGWTSTNYAALGCPDFPTCHGQWVPPLALGEAFTFWHGLGQNFEFGILDNRARATIHFVHRIGAIIVTAVLLWFAWRLWRRARLPAYAGVVTAALALQIGIGIGIVELQLPLWLATGHNFGAALLLITLVLANQRLWRRS